MNETLDKLADEIAVTAFAKFRVLVDAHLSRAVTSGVKLTFSEEEAAEQLGVSPSTLAAWRRRGIINFARYPQAKNDALSDMYSYSEIDLLDFRNRYVNYNNGRGK